LDDVSTSYPDQNDLLAARGQTAVDFSYRVMKFPGGDAAFPTKQTQRGGASKKICITSQVLIYSSVHHLGGGGSSRSRGYGKKGKYGCPTVPL
jgi:hypothetical protein